MWTLMTRLVRAARQTYGLSFERVHACVLTHLAYRVCSELMTAGSCARSAVTGSSLMLPLSLCLRGVQLHLHMCIIRPRAHVWWVGRTIAAAR